MTPFCFEHEFAAGSTTTVFAAYFDAVHQAEQDRALRITRREILELEDTGRELRRVCRVVPARQLPAVARPFVAGELHFIESAVWRRDADAISIEIELGKRVQITATYLLEAVGSSAIRRTYRGAVSVDIALVGARVERAIVGELECSMTLAAACTQAWLDAGARGADRHEIRSVAARA